MGFVGRQSGLSLIELMISMLLASIITAAAIAMLVSDSQTSRFQINQTSAHTSGRFAFDFLLSDLRRAGYSKTTPINVAVEGVNGAGTNNDELTIRYDALAANNRDCVGNALVGPPDANPAVNVYRIEDVDGRNTLTCNGEPVMRGVDGFQVLFGVDQDLNGTLDRYVPPGAVATGQRVVTVQVAMLVATLERGGENVAQQFQLLDVSTDSFTDGRGRTLFTTTERIRNNNPDEVL